MLVPVFIARDSDNGFVAVAPDFPGCIARGAELGRTITRIHLQIEGRVSDLLISGQAVPPIDFPEKKSNTESAGPGQLYPIDINLVHLAAVAQHQTRAGRAATPK